MSDLLRVDAVIVPLSERGFAFAHGPSGECIRFTGPREAMVALGNLLKSSIEKGEHVFIDPQECHEPVSIQNADDCWIHPFIDAPEPAA